MLDDRAKDVFLGSDSFHYKAGLLINRLKRLIVSTGVSAINQDWQLVPNQAKKYVHIVLTGWA